MKKKKKQKKKKKHNPTIVANCLLAEYQEKTSSPRDLKITLQSTGLFHTERPIACIGEKMVVVPLRVIQKVRGALVTAGFMLKVAGDDDSRSLAVLCDILEAERKQ